MSSGKYRYTVTRTAWENVPPGTYTLRLTGVEDGPTFTNTKTGAPESTVKLLLEVDRGPSKGMGLSALVNPDRWGPKSNSTRWAEALVGRALEVDEAFDFEDYIDTRVWAKVVVEPDSKNVERNKVDVVMSLAAIDVQTDDRTPARPPARSGAAPRPAPPTRGPRLGAGLEATPDRELELPDDPGWHAMTPPPAEAGSER